MLFFVFFYNNAMCMEEIEARTQCKKIREQQKAHGT